MRVGRGAEARMATLLWGMLFGTLGLGYCVYARRQREPVPLVCGVALMVFPYFVASAWATVLVGAVLLVLPWCVRP
jgi:hypothetical protein